MGWDRRGYYYRAKKVDGRVVREYVGQGEIAALVEQNDLLDREKRKLDFAQERAQQDEMNALDELLNDLNEQIDLLARVVLLAAGYRRHKRGEWRKKRAGR